MEKVGDTRYFTNGNVAIVEDVKIEITELPIGTWTQTYKENVLEPLINGNEKQKAVITDYKEYHTHTTVRFVVSFAPGEFEKLDAEQGGFHRVFKLSSSMSTSSMHGFDKDNCLRRFDKGIFFGKSISNSSPVFIFKQTLHNFANFSSQRNFA